MEAVPLEEPGREWWVPRRGATWWSERCRHKFRDHHSSEGIAVVSDNRIERDLKIKKGKLSKNQSL